MSTERKSNSRAPRKKQRVEFVYEAPADRKQKGKVSRIPSDDNPTTDEPDLHTKRQRHVFYPDPFQSSTWVTGPKQILQQQIEHHDTSTDGGMCSNIHPIEILTTREDANPDTMEGKTEKNEVFTVDREEMIATVLTDIKQPVSGAYAKVPWVVKEFRTEDPFDIDDDGYCAVRAQLIACFVSADFRYYKHDGKKDSARPYTRNMCPIYRHWQCVVEYNGKIRSFVYIAMPRGDLVLTRYIRALFTRDLSTEHETMRSCRSVIHVITQVMSGLKALQTPELMMAHNDLHTDNVLVFLPESEYYKKCAPQDLTVVGTTDTVTIPIKSDNRPWCLIYDLELSRSNRWTHLYLQGSKVYPIKLYHDVIMFVSDIRDEIATCCAENKTIDLQGHTPLLFLDQALFEITQGFVKIPKIKEYLRLIKHPDLVIAQGSRTKYWPIWDRQAMRRAISGNTDTLLQSITPRNCIDIIAQCGLLEDPIPFKGTDIKLQEPDRIFQDPDYPDSSFSYTKYENLTLDWESSTSIPFVSPDDALAGPLVDANGSVVQTNERPYYNVVNPVKKIRRRGKS